MTFTVPSNGIQVTLTPNVMSLFVGQTRSIQALDAQGAAVTGLVWSSSDPALVALSAADPPMLTAVASGTAQITAGGASAEVTVYADAALPDGTVVWSHPGTGSSVLGVYIAVPNYDAVADVFLQNHESVQALTSEGTVAWTTSLPQVTWNTSVLADFQGGAVVADPQFIYRLEALTGQPSPPYLATTEDAQFVGLGYPAIHTDGTIFTVDYACANTSCPWAHDGTVGAWVVGIDPSTAGTKFRVPLVNSVVTTTVNDATFCQTGTPGTSTLAYHPSPSVMTIAGDGYAYLSYRTIDSTDTLHRAVAQPLPEAVYDLWDQLRSDTSASNFSAARADLQAILAATGETFVVPGSVLDGYLSQGNRSAAINFENGMAPSFRRLCDSTMASETKMHLMRVGADGSSSDVVAKQWSANWSEVFTLAAAYPGYRRTQTQTGPAFVILDMNSNSTITNADTGALYSWAATPVYPDQPIDPVNFIGVVEDHITTTAGGGIVSDVTWDQGGHLSASPVQVVLQLEDDSFAGTVGYFPNVTILVFNTAGEIKWTLPGYSPAMATPGGGLIAGNATGTHAFDGDGNAIGQVASVPIYSWVKAAYTFRSGSGLAQVVAPNIEWGTSFAAMPYGNPSATGTFVGVAEQMFSSPVFGLSFFGPTCNLGNSKPSLAGQARTVYNAKRDSLRNSGTISSQMCQQFFTDTTRLDWNPARAAYSTMQVIAGVDRQDPFNGRLATLSMFDAGVFAGAAVSNPAALSALRRILTLRPVCGEFIPKPDLTTAMAQAAAPPSTQAPNPPQDIFVNSDSVAISILSEGTVLHEALHNLTGRIDPDLLSFVGLPPLKRNETMIDSFTHRNRITQKLVEVGCAAR
jgi:hypothetical protein